MSSNAVQPVIEMLPSYQSTNRLTSNSRAPAPSEQGPGVDAGLRAGSAHRGQLYPLAAAHNPVGPLSAACGA